MRAINHALTGAIIGLAVNEPIIALPAALASHYILDVIPHHGVKLANLAFLRSKIFRNLLYLDAALCGLLIASIVINQPYNWLLAVSCAFIAAAPDFFSINRYIKALQKKPWKPGAYAKFATGIQWFERPIGAVVEIAWFFGAIMVVKQFLV